MAAFGLALVFADKCLLRFSAEVSTKDGLCLCVFPDVDDLSLRILKLDLIRERDGLFEEFMAKAVRLLWIVGSAEGTRTFDRDVANAVKRAGCDSRIKN
jgi:hypothetical protein